MKGRHARLRRWQRLVRWWASVPGTTRWAGGLALIAIFGLGAVWGAHDYDTTLARGGLVVEAVVVQYDQCDSPCTRNSEASNYVVDLPTAEGVRRVKVFEYYWRRKRPGDRVRVLYAPADPEYYVRDANVPLESAGRDEALLVGALASGALLLWQVPQRVRRYYEARRSGQRPSTPLLIDRVRARLIEQIPTTTSG